MHMMPLSGHRSLMGQSRTYFAYAWLPASAMLHMTQEAVTAHSAGVPSERY